MTDSPAQLVAGITGTVGIVGAGAVGSRVARQLLVTDPECSVLLSDVDQERLGEVVESLDSRAAAAEVEVALSQVDVVVIAAACGDHPSLVRRAIDNGVSVVSTSDRPDDVERILQLSPLAIERGTPVLAGVGFSPGLSCVLASLASEQFDRVDEVHVARAGTGGPACARQHHRALKGSARDWRDGEWIRRPGGSGRELIWFPDPVGGADCYRAALPDSRLLHPRFPDCHRITARVAASRQDRFTSWLPMLSPPHAEGGIGALRVEVRGRIAGRREIHVSGAVEKPAIGAAAVVAAAVSWLSSHLEDDEGSGLEGVSGLAAAVSPRAFVREVVARGIRVQEFEGHTAG